MEFSTGIWAQDGLVNGNTNFKKILTPQRNTESQYKTCYQLLKDENNDPLINSNSCSVTFFIKNKVNVEKNELYANINVFNIVLQTRLH